MPPKSALLSKLAARKASIQAAVQTKSTAPLTNDEHATNNKQQTDENAATTHNNPQALRKLQSSSPAQPSKPGAVSSAGVRQRTAHQSVDDEEEQDSDSSEDESDSFSYATSSSSSEYVSSDDDVDEDGHRLYRIFFCPVPASCADAHKKNINSDKALAPIDPYAMPPTGPSPCHESIQSVLSASLRSRCKDFGNVIAVDIQSKMGVPCAEEEIGVKKIAKGMIACRECLACPACREFTQRHFAYVTLRGKLERVNQLLLTFNRSKWRGEFVRVEMAKLDFKPRSAAERQAMKKKKFLTQEKEAGKKRAAAETNTKEVVIPQGQIETNWKDQFGYKHLVKEHMTQKEFTEAESIKPTALSELDWSEPVPPSPTSLPRAPIDYELLSAVFSGLSSAPPPVAKSTKKRKYRNEDEEWGALERGEDDESAATKKHDTEENQDTDESEEEQANGSEGAAEGEDASIDEEDEWAKLEQSDEPAAKATKKKNVEAEAPSKKARTEKALSQKKPVAELENEDELDMDAEFAALEQEGTASESDNEKMDEADPENGEEEQDEEDEEEAEEEAEAEEEEEDEEEEEEEEEKAVQPAPKKASAASTKFTASPKLSAASDKPKVTKASSWFGSDSEGDDEDAAVDFDKNTDRDELTLRAAFKGKKASEMIELERSYGGDDRFKLDARFEEKDEEEERRAAKANEEANAEMAEDNGDAEGNKEEEATPAGLHPSLAKLAPDEFMRQHLLAEKRRALSILDEVAARPGYQTLSLEEVAADRSSTVGLDDLEHKQMLASGKSMKSLQLELKGASARGKRRPDAHYTRSSFEDTAEFLSDDFDPALLQSLSSADKAATEGDNLIKQAISVSLQKWMPILDEDGNAAGGTSAASLAQRIQIEAEDEEIERRKKMRFWKDVARFDPSAEDAKEASASPVDAEKAGEESQNASITPLKGKKPAAPESKKSAAKTAAAAAVAAPSQKKLSVYTPQLQFNPAPDRASVTVRNDGDRLYEIKTDRLRNLFSNTAPLTFALADDKLTSAATATGITAEASGPTKPAEGIIGFKFGFSLDAGESDDKMEDATETANPASLRSLFSSAPTPATSTLSFATASSSSPKLNPSSSSPALKPTPPATSAAAASAIASFHVPSWPEGHPNNPYKSTAAPTTAASAPTTPAASVKPTAIAAATAASAAKAKAAATLRASAFVKSLIAPVASASNSAKAAAMARKSGGFSLSSSSSDDDDSDAADDTRAGLDEDDDEPASSFMRSRTADDESLTAAWMEARKAATIDFKNKNKSAVRKSGGKKEMVRDDAAGGLKRSVESRALEVLEQSEGKSKKRH